jgi:hypothetical protein
MFICLNPSIADGNTDDPTLRRLMGFAYQWGFGGLYLGNLFAFRSTSPVALHKSINIIGPDNNQHLLTMSLFCSKVVFAWGNHGNLNNRDQQVVEMFGEAACIGKTNEGHPKHPLYLKKDSSLVPYQLEII